MAVAAGLGKMISYKRPADQSDAVQKKRAKYGQKYYEKYGKAPKVYDVVISDGSRKIC